jgi:16S rRNA (adenine1518-N6/adenine1519-N6)-dimethyltransferase
MRPRATRHPPARKRFGQHFLEPVWAEKVVGAIAPTPDAAILEIGPGRGALTGLLARIAAHVVAFEIDRDLATRLRATAPPNLIVAEGDFLACTIDGIRQAIRHTARPATDAVGNAAPLRVAGNLPYNVACPIMFKLVELADLGLPLVDATLMLQREVADRLLAQPGTKDYGALSILIGRVARVEPLLTLPPGAFRPMPRVQSALVRLTFHRPAPAVANDRAFTELVRALFTRRRKMLANALLAYRGLTPPVAASLLAATAIDPRRRPETLTLAELARLSDESGLVLRGSAVL